MRINSQHNFQHKNKTAFTSKPLFDVNIKKLDEYGNDAGLVPAQVVEFHSSNYFDEMQIEDVLYNWQGIHYSKSIALHFLKNHVGKQFLGVQTKQRGKSLVSIAEIELPPHSVTATLDLIQSAPNAEFGKPNREYKGAGEVLMYGICKLARGAGFRKINLESANNYFWENKIGMSLSQKLKDCRRLHYLDLNSMQNFMERIKKKYNF